MLVVSCKHSDIQMCARRECIVQVLFQDPVGPVSGSVGDTSVEDHASLCSFLHLVHLQGGAAHEDIISTLVYQYSRKHTHLLSVMGRFFGLVHMDDICDTTNIYIHHTHTPEHTHDLAPLHILRIVRCLWRKTSIRMYRDDVHRKPDSI